MLLDTSVLIRTLQPQHPLYEQADRAIRLLPEQGRELCIVPQNLVELWVVATRPIDRNGLGMTPAQASQELSKLKVMFVLLPDNSAIYPAWEELVTRHGVSGKPSHDARLVAAMKVHGLTAILTFDHTGFSRFSGIQVVHPSAVEPITAAPVEAAATAEGPGTGVAPANSPE